MSWLIALAVLTAFAAVYATIIRPMTRDAPWAKGFYGHPVVQWIELKFWGRSETLFWARYQQFLGAVLIATGYLGGIDYSIFAPVVPDSVVLWLPLIPVILNFFGSIAEAQRRDTSEPLEEVALPDVVRPEVAEAVAVARAAKVNMKMVIEEDKAKGTD